MPNPLYKSWDSANLSDAKKDSVSNETKSFCRARDGDRTRDPLLGKEVLHR